MSILVLQLLPIKDITNACGRVLQSSKPYETELDDSMDSMVMLKCVFDKPCYVGPYKSKGVLTFKAVDNFVLFAEDECKNDVCLNDINQGLIGDCWFLSAIDFVVNNPIYHDRIKQIVQVYDKDKGVIQVKLFDTSSGVWKETFVDTRLLVNGDYVPVTMSVLSRNPAEIWAAMLEKGLAKMCGGYPKIEGGWMSEGMSFLLSGRGFFISSKDIVSFILQNDGCIDAICNDLAILRKEGYGLFTAWSEETFTDVKEYGLVTGHAYSILDFKKVNSDWVFKLMNPWGKFEWKGAYSDNDMSEESVYAHKVFDSLKYEDDGIFLMSFADLFARCEGLDIFEPLCRTIISDACKNEK
jgi:calpain-15